MPAPIVVEFLQRGMPAIQNAIRSVEQAALQAERARTSSAQRASRERQSVTEREVREATRLRDRAIRELASAERKGVAEAKRAAKEKEQAADKEMKALVRAAEQSAQARLRAERMVDREIQKIGKDREREHNRLLREGNRLEAQSIRDSIRLQRQKDQAAALNRDRFNRAMGGAVASGVRGGFSLVGRAVSSGFGMMGQLAGGFGIADSVEREVGLHRVAGQIAASTVTDPGQRKLGTGDIVSRAKAIGIEQAIDPKDIAEAIGKFKDLTGQTARAVEMMPELAKLSNAFGANIAELSENAGNIALADPNLTNADVMRLLRVQTRQGAVGAVELKDMAKFGARLTAGAGLIEGDRSTNIATLSAFAQVARQHGGAASPAEATLAAQRFVTDIQGKAGKLREQGIEVGGEVGPEGTRLLRDPRQVILDMLQKTKGDVTKFKTLGLGERGMRVLTGFADVYGQAGGGNKGLEAVDKELEKFTGGVSDAEVDQRAKERLADADKQLEKVFIELRSAIGTQLLPEFIKMIPVLRDSIPAITSFLQSMTEIASWAAKNPFAGIAGLIGASVLKEVTAASIGQVTARALSGSIVSQAGVIGAAAAAALAIGIATIEMERAKIDEARNRSVGTSTQVFTEAKGIQGKIARGEASAADVERLKVLQSAIATQAEKEQKNVNQRSDLAMALTPLSQLGITDEAEKREQADREERLRQTKQASDELQKAFEMLAESARKNARVLENSKPAAGGTSNAPAAANTGIVQRTGAK